MFRELHSLMFDDAAKAHLSLAVLEELLVGLLLLSGTGKVGIVELIGVDTRHIHLGGGGDDIGGVHTLEGNTVDLERARDDEETRGENLQAHRALSHQWRRGMGM